MNMSDSMKNKRYMPGLDGLRALSVIAVIAYHLNLPWASGGFLGVGIFFTLSGYLITDQLMMQWQSSCRINLKDFWLRRLRRLMPAILFMLTATYIWLALFDRSRLGKLQEELVPVMLYINNWWLIFHNVSYFESFGPPSPIGHLWSLAIEEQFYFFWPIILMILLRFLPKRRSLVFSILAGAVASILAMALIYQPGSDPSRVYYGTDTRAFALLIGAAFAIACPSRRLPRKISAQSRRGLDAIGGASLLSILLIILKTNEYDSYIYTGGLAVFAFISAIVTVVLAHPASSLAKFMGCKPLRWIGVRSYSLYLWHYPVIILSNPSVYTGELNISRIILQIALSFLLAAFSWKFVEEPIRRGSLQRWLSGYKVQNSDFIRTFFQRRFLLIPITALLILFVISYANRINKGNAQPATSTIVDGQIQENSPPASSKGLTSPSVSPEKPETDTTDKSSTGQSSEVDPPALEDESGKEITVIGDSVILDAAPYLEKSLPGIRIDSKIGRQMSHAQELVDQLKAEGKLGNRVIIELGTNGAFAKKQLRQLLTSLGDMKQVILVNVRVPKGWQNTVNYDLKTVAAEFSNTTIVDWFSASKGKDSFFSSDNVHLNQKGASYYASLIYEAVQKVK